MDTAILVRVEDFCTREGLLQPGVPQHLAAAVSGGGGVSPSPAPQPASSSIPSRHAKIRFIFIHPFFLVLTAQGEKSSPNLGALYKIRPKFF